MTTSKELYAKAAALDLEVTAMKKQAHELHLQELRAIPLQERLVYAAHARCDCGAGLAYDPANCEGEKRCWDCSDILLAKAIVKGLPGWKTHTAPLPFAFYEVKSENQPSAYGATTRPKQEA